MLAIVVRILIAVLAALATRWLVTKVTEDDKIGTVAAVIVGILVFVYVRVTL